MRRKLIGLGLTVVVLIVLPFAVSDFRTGQLAAVGATLIAILGLDILIGSNGQVSLGHGAFMAVGAYTTAILVAHHGIRDLWTIAAAAGVAGALGLVVGVSALRLRGLYLALATFGVAVVLPTVLLKFDHFTGGSTGISFFGSPHATGRGDNARLLYALTWLVGGALFLLAWWLVGSRFGRTLRAIRDSERAATVSGISTSAYKVAAFGLSAAYAGVAGSLLAINAAYVSPSLFSVQLSLYLLAGAVVGGFGSIWGAVLGALLIQFMPDLIGAIPSVDTTRAGPTTFAFGAVLVALMLFRPLVARVATKILP